VACRAFSGVCLAFGEPFCWRNSLCTASL